MEPFSLLGESIGSRTPVIFGDRDLSDQPESLEFPQRASERGWAHRGQGMLDPAEAKRPISPQESDHAERPLLPDHVDGPRRRAGTVQFHPLLAHFPTYPSSGGLYHFSG